MSEMKIFQCLGRLHRNENWVIKIKVRLLFQSAMCWLTIDLCYLIAMRCFVDFQYTFFFACFVIDEMIYVDEHLWPLVYYYQFVDYFYKMISIFADFLIVLFKIKYCRLTIYNVVRSVAKEEARAPYPQIKSSFWQFFSDLLKKCLKISFTY